MKFGTNVGVGTLCIHTRFNQNRTERERNAVNRSQFFWPVRRSGDGVVNRLTVNNLNHHHHHHLMSIFQCSAWVGWLVPLNQTPTLQSCADSLLKPSQCRSCPTHSSQVLFGLPLLPCADLTTKPRETDTQSLLLLCPTWPNHLSRPRLTISATSQLRCVHKAHILVQHSGNKGTFH
jgi:hypothetical protein